MKAFHKIKRKANIGREYLSEDFWVDGLEVKLEDFKFIEGTHYIFHPETKNFELLCNLKLSYWWNKDGETIVTTIQCDVGFFWNGADIPKKLKSLIGDRFAAEFALASCFHDKATTMCLGHYPESRIFYEILKTRKGKNDIPWWKEKAMYIGVYLWSVYSS